MALGNNKMSPRIKSRCGTWHWGDIATRGNEAGEECKLSESVRYSADLADSAFIPRPENWVLPINLRFVAPDGQWLEWEFTTFLQLCQGEGCVPTCLRWGREFLCGVNVKWTDCVRFVMYSSTCLGHWSDWFPERKPGGQTCQQYSLFAEGQWLFLNLWDGNCASVCGYSKLEVGLGGGRGDDKAAAGVWQRKGKFQTVNKASQQNVTDSPPSQTSICAVQPTPHAHTLNRGPSLSI